MRVGEEPEGREAGSTGRRTSRPVSAWGGHCPPRIAGRQGRWAVATLRLLCLLQGSKTQVSAYRDLWHPGSAATMSAPLEGGPSSACDRGESSNRGVV